MKTHVCLNIECKKTYSTKNPKKKFCTLNCKNRSAYVTRQKDYSWEESSAKARRYNVKILEQLMKKKITHVTIDQLTILGFNFEAPVKPFVDHKNEKVFRYGNIGLKQINKNEFTLLNL